MRPRLDGAVAQHRADDVVRFDRTERNVHWWTAALVGLCALTSLGLSIAPIASIVGQRDLLRQIHVVAGLAIPVPFVVGWIGPWSRRLRATVTQLDRFDDEDRRWFRTLGNRSARPARSGRFHPGQKLNAAVVAASIVLLLATGFVLRWFEPFPLGVRRGATFVHDWVAFLLAIDLLAHIAKGFRDREALRAITSGVVTKRWAETEHPRWTTAEET
ncbi:MAG TPA: cytochrome b/b6 domain-containing protein [Acidimicrobiales bacterium]|jgi:formate dehydrogenase subunit gamma|nr:cytochrome b/b6 domain-containing protein [Acidimicrobiales bacterium]